MDNMGNKKICGANLKNDSLNVVTPPQVNCNLQGLCVRGQGDFQDGNRPLDFCLIFNTHVRMGNILMTSIRSLGAVNTEMRT